MSTVLRLVGSVALVAGCLGIVAGRTTAQAPANPKPAMEKKAEQRNSIIELKHISPGRFADFMTTFGRDSSITFETTEEGRIRIRGDNVAQLSKAAEAISALDRVSFAYGQSLRVLPYKSSEDESFLRSMIEVMYGGSLKYSIDANRRQIVLLANDPLVDSVREILKTMEAEPKPPTVAAVPPPLATPKDVALRVVVFTDRNPQKEEQKLPPDLEVVAKAISGLGVKNPTIASQFFLRGFDGTELQARGIISTGEPFTAIQAECTSSPKGWTVAIRIYGDGGGEVEIGEIYGKLSVPAGRFVLLGMTPLNGSQRIYAVQVTSPDDK